MFKLIFGYLWYSVQQCTWIHTFWETNMGNKIQCHFPWYVSHRVVPFVMSLNYLTIPNFNARCINCIWINDLLYMFLDLNRCVWFVLLTSLRARLQLFINLSHIYIIVTDNIRIYRLPKDRGMEQWKWYFPSRRAIVE